MKTVNIIADKYIKRIWLFILFIIINILFGLLYVSNSARNLVFMDFWRNINLLIPQAATGGWPWQSMWSSTFGQRNFLQLFLITFNIKYTSLNCIWESYAGILVIALSCILLFREWNLILFEDEKYFVKQLLFLPVMTVLFSLNQWEILSLQFSFAFMVRICGYITAFLLTDKIFHSNKDNFYIVLCGVYVGLLVDFVSQLYWPSLIIVLAISWIIYFSHKEKSKKKVKELVLFWIPIVISVFIYCFKLNTNGAGGGLDIFWNLLVSGEFWLAILYMLVGSLLPQTKIEKMNQSSIVMLGILFLIIIVLAVFSFFYKNLCDISFVPMMLCAYGLVTIPIIIYGRAGNFNLMYLTSSRYTCETTLIWAGCCLSFSMLIYKYRKILLSIPLISVVAFVIFSDCVELEISPYRGQYKDQLITIMKDIDEYGDDELIGFQAGNANLVRSGVQLMKDYNLGIWSNR